MLNRNKFIRLFTIVLAVVMAAALLTGCSGSGEVEGAGHSQSQSTVESTGSESTSSVDSALSVESDSQPQLDENGAVYWYDSDSPDEFYYYNVSAMSDGFAVDNDTGDIYAFGFEFENGEASAMIAICMTDSQYAEFSDMVDWTYSNDETPLDPIHVTGYFSSWNNDQDLIDLAVEGLQTFWGDDTLTESDLEDYVGNGFMDIRAMGSING